MMSKPIRPGFVRLCVLLATLSICGPLAAAPTAPTGAALAAAANLQVGVTLGYDAAYRKIAYPGGDVAQQTGVCTDVVIRAYRRFGIDLQLLVHQDMSRAFAAYPKLWQLKTTDTNIDHRRVPNLATFFKRHGQTLAVNQDGATWLAGDIVTWRLSSGVPHIGIIAPQRTNKGVPLVIHNIGEGAKLEDRLFEYAVTGHYRYLPR